MEPITVNGSPGGAGGGGVGGAFGARKMACCADLSCGLPQICTGSFCELRSSVIPERPLPVPARSSNSPVFPV